MIKGPDEEVVAHERDHHDGDHREHSHAEAIESNREQRLISAVAGLVLAGLTMSIAAVPWC